MTQSITVQIIVKNGHFHPVPLGSFGFHLVYMKVQVQMGDMNRT
jgi:hypothetical protein